MFASFFRYFISYIFKARTRQRLLFLALFSLSLSSFALVVLQGVMTGLQSSLVERSKQVYGDFYVNIASLDRKTQDKIILDLEDYEIPAFPEKETELFNKIKDHYGKKKHQVVTCKEFSKYTGIDEDIVNKYIY